MTRRFRPAYLGLHESGELAERASRAKDLITSCTLCPRRCGVDRSAGETGFCRTGSRAIVASYGPHFGEEPPLVGRKGSGTIFISRCNLSCIFCQNTRISRNGEGREVSGDELAGMMLSLWKSGCHNINIVTPSHIVPQLLESIAIAAGRGLDIPIVFNTGGYDSVDTLRLLDGVVDIYMPDAKYGDTAVAAVLSYAPEYPAVMKAAIAEMHRQVGDLVVEEGIAVRGLIIRHLVLPGGLAGSGDILPWIAREISRDSYVNIMDQYHWPAGVPPPAWFADQPSFRALLRPVTAREYADALRLAREAGLHRGF